MLTKILKTIFFYYLILNFKYNPKLQTKIALAYEKNTRFERKINSFSIFDKNYFKYMDLTGIISISGKPGLYKVVARGKNNIIVESLIDGKKIPAYSTDRISALEDISIYTYEEDLPLKDVFEKIFDKENGGATISHKESANKLKAYTEEILPNYDQDRVYPSDLKKLYQWYNLTHKAGLLVKAEEENEAPQENEKDTKVKGEKEKEKKKAPAKKTTKTAKKDSPAKAKTEKKEAKPKAKKTESKSSGKSE
jgi:hypothetical protein